MSTRRKLLLAFVACGAVLLLVVVAARPPLLLRISEPDAVMRPTIAIFKPWRDRAPEQVAEQLFRELQRGEVVVAMSRVRGGPDAHLVEKERAYPLRRWRLVNRVDDRDLVRLSYATERGPSMQVGSDVNLFLAREGNRWFVKSYLPMY
jgi:hypothetical protein